MFSKTTIVKLKWTGYQKRHDLFVNGRQLCFSSQGFLVDCGRLLIGMENPVLYFSLIEMYNPVYHKNPISAMFNNNIS